MQEGMHRWPPPLLTVRMIAKKGKKKHAIVVERKEILRIPHAVVVLWSDAIRTWICGTYNRFNNVIFHNTMACLDAIRMKSVELNSSVDQNSRKNTSCTSRLLRTGFWDIDLHTITCLLTYLQTHTHTYTHSHTQTHTYTHILTYTHTNTHTHTHAYNHT